jgi:tight adherence protein B
VLVLSDGADTGSRTDRASAATLARAANARIFTVGLRSWDADPDALRWLAGAGDGTYAEASSPASVAPIFARIGRRLAHQYVVRYRSEARPGTRVQVVVKVAGHAPVVAAQYVTPSLPSGHGVFHRDALQRFWVSSAAVVLVTLAAALLAGFVVVLLARPRRRTVRQRMAHFVSMPPARRGSSSSAAQPAGTAREPEDGSEDAGWWQRLQDDMAIAGFGISPSQALFGTLAVTALLALVLAAATGRPFLAVLALAVPFAGRAYVTARLRRLRRAFGSQLADNLQVLASALRAGHSFTAALALMVDDAPEPARSEFHRVIADEQLGVPLEDALRVVARRMQSDDLEQIALVAALQRQTGGNTAEVLERVTKTIREREELRRIVRSLTAQGRMSRWVVTALPVGLLVALSVLNPTFMSPLYGRPAGQAMLVVAAVMMTAGSLVLKKIVDIEI